MPNHTFVNAAFGFSSLQQSANNMILDAPEGPSLFFSETLRNDRKRDRPATPEPLGKFARIAAQRRGEVLGTHVDARFVYDNMRVYTAKLQLAVRRIQRAFRRFFGHPQWPSALIGAI